ncbi:uncharacterized protein LOC124116648 [Haliotis rufescens]|uniref:uncharacterized protein LOC124116648 n=1 Tax=Haliotis rufescens TaxID=6454 RepID=UPI00201EB1B4|nr:uncharacterized protein LOC124116648 [Haliotis rufescens]
MAGFVIRRLVGRSDLKHVAKLVKQEDWGVSLPNLMNFYDISPSGWWVAEKSDGSVVGTCKMFTLEDNTTCHGGMYVVDKQHRDQGIGTKLSNTAIRGAQDKNILITTLKPELNLKLFKPLHDITIMSLKKTNQKLPPLRRTGFRILPLADVPLERLEKYDARIHPVKRTAVFHRFIIADASFVFVALESMSGDVIGYGALKRTSTEWEFCPTYADTDDVGYELIRTMFDKVPDGNTIEVTPFAENQKAIDVYKEIGFYTKCTAMLMYSKKPLIIPTKKVFSTAGSDYVLM